MFLALCDDDSVQMRYTRKILEENRPPESLMIREFLSAESLLRSISVEKYLPEVAVLDIDMAGMNGIDLAKALNRTIPNCSIIFLTGHMEYCSAVYETEHIFFILKEHAEKYLPEALKKAIQASRHREEQSVVISSRGNKVLVPLNEIRYLESVLRKLIIHTSDGEYEVYARLDHFLSEEQSKKFVRCHKSYLVNINAVAGIDSSGLLLTGGEKIPISRSRLEEVKQRFFDIHMDS